MKQIIYFDVAREGYSIGQIKKTMTVRELIDQLEGFEEDAPIYISHDNGYTYGSLRDSSINEDYVEGEEDDEEA